MASNALHSSFCQSNCVVKTCQLFRFVSDKLCLGELWKICLVLRKSLRRLAEVFFVAIFFSVIYSIWGLHLYHGRFRQQCVPMFPSDEDLPAEDGVLCGNNSGTVMCPDKEVCLSAGKNPNFGYTNFDDFGWSLLSGIRLFATDYWEGMYHIVRDTTGMPYILFFVIVITTSTCLLALFPAVFILTLFEEEEERIQKKKVANNVNGSHGKPINDEGCGTHFSAAFKVQSDRKADCQIRVIDMENENKFCEISQKGITNKTSVTGNQTTTDCQAVQPCFGCEDSRCYGILCLWSCCPRVREKVARVVFDPFAELLVTVAVIFNIVSTSLDSAFLEESYDLPLKTSLRILAVVMTLEAVLKLFALSPGRYFRNWWHIIDVLMIANMTHHLLVSHISGITFLQIQLGVVKLGRLWPTLNRFFYVLGKAGLVLWNFIVLISLISMTYAAIGMGAFGKYYTENKLKDFQPRWNFIDFFHSWLSVFRTYCGEWIEVAWDCMFLSGVSSVLYFLISFIIGHLILVYLFLAFLTNAGNSESSDNPPTDDSKRLYAVLERIAKLGRWIQSRTCLSKVHPSTNQGNLGRDQPKHGESGHVQMENEDTDDMEMDIIQILQERSRPEDAPPRCCPDPIYASSICWNNHSRFGQKVRMACYILVQKPWFEHVVSFVIIVYKIFLTCEDQETKKLKGFDVVLNVVNIFVGCFYLLEMLIRWTGIGMKQYFLDFWCWIDFVVVLTFVSELFLYGGGHSIPVFLHVVRVIRIFRIIRELYIFESSRVVLNALLQAFPGVLNAFVMAAFYWLMFAIMFSQFFMGVFYYCSSSEDGERVNETYVPNKDACMQYNHTWMNSELHFDNLLDSFFTLFYVAAIKGWIDVAHAAVDSHQFGHQPVVEVNIYMIFTIIGFIVFCSFVTYSILVGVILDGFYRQKILVDSNSEGLSVGEKIYCYVKRKLALRYLRETYFKPKFGLRAKVYNLVSSERFGFAINCLILFSMIVLALMNNDMNEMTGYTNAFLSLYDILLALFAIESGMKLFAFRLQYFKSIWNLVDIVAVLLGFVDIILDLTISRTIFPPLLLRIFRIPRRLRFLGTCNQTFKIAFPRLLTAAFLTFLVIFSYSVLALALPSHHNPTTFRYQSFRIAMENVFQMAFVLHAGELRSSLRTAVDSVFIVSLGLIVYVFLMSLLLVIVVVSYQEASERVEEGINSDDVHHFYAEWKKYDLLETGYIKSVDLQSLLNGLEKPLQVSTANKYTIGVLDIPICKDDTIHHVDVLDAVIRTCLSEKGYHIRDEVVLEKFFPPTDKGYEPVSSTLWRQREQLCARVIQKWWKLVASKAKTESD